MENQELTNVSNAISVGNKFSFQIRKIFSLRNFKSAARSSLILIGIGYIFSVSEILSINKLLSNPEERSILLVKVIGLGLLIYFMFYVVIKFFLRLLFHSRLRNKVRENRDEFNAQINFQNKRDFVVNVRNVGELIYNYFIKFGLINSGELSTPLVLNNEQKEEVFNDILNDVYSWILLIFHTAVTVFIVWNYYSLWFIILISLALIFMLIVATTIVYVLMHLETLEYFRRDLISRSKKLM